MGRIILFIILLFFSGCEKKEKAATSFNTTTGAQSTVQKNKDKHVLTSQLAGTWYTENSSQLKNELMQYLEEANSGTYAGINALVLPHAGYRYSGKVAASGVKQLTGKHYNRVVILGPTHRYNLENKINLPTYTHYKTPLGEIPLDTGFIDSMTGSYYVTQYPEVHLNEHSVQIELPLLQLVLKEFLLVPVVVGQLDSHITVAIAQKLLSLMDNNTLVVVSSDFCHYGQNYGFVPFTKNVRENIRSLDMEAFDLIREKDLNGFLEYLDRTGATICGRHPISILLAMANNHMAVHLESYNTSGAVTGDFTNSVSYLSIIYEGGWDKKGNPGIKFNNEELTRQDKKNLLVLARKTLEYYLKNNRQPGIDELGVHCSKAMERVMGGFVTLHKNSALRGCIGDIFPQRPLYRVVMNHAVNAAVNDSRFLPVREEELAEIEFEISALTPPEKAASYKEIIPGKHGIVLSKQGHSAVFLPQVAPEQGWNLAQTLSHLSIKAGLPEDAWLEGAEFFIFKAIVFSETDAK